MSLLKAANSVFDSVKYYINPEEDNNNNNDNKDRNDDKLKTWAIASAIGVSAVGLMYAAANMYRARQHDNIPTLAIDDYTMFVGHLPKLLSLKHDFHEWMYQSVKKMNYPPLVSVSIPMVKYVFIQDPKLIKFAMETNFDSVQKGEQICEEYEPLLGKGIFVSNGEKWKFHRKV